MRAFFIMEQDTSVITHVLTAIGTLGGWKVFEYFNNRKKISQDGFEILQKAWKEEFSRLEGKIERANLEIGKRGQIIEKMEVEIRDLKNRMVILSATTPSLPIPAWRKAPDGIMLGVNPAYEKTFLMPLGFVTSDCVGSPDEKIWGQEIATHFKKHDDEAKENKDHTAIIFEEHHHNLLKDWVFLKYPEFIDGVLVSIAGIAIPKRDYLNSIKK